MMNIVLQAEPFSECYAEARRRFRAASQNQGFSLESYVAADPSAGESVLSMDIASLGPADAPTLVISSGVHGVEGFLGSALQIALLESLAQLDLQHLRLVLIHAVNPFGFANLRRVDQENVDLNRNFLADSHAYHGAPKGYHALNTFLNPKSAPRFEWFPLQALSYLLRYGMPALSQAIVGGQYEYPEGLFFGGQAPSRSTRIVQEKYVSWIGNAEKVLHLDIHSGLGRFGTHQLLTHETAASSRLRWYQQTFGQPVVKFVQDESGAAKYQASGSIGEWLHRGNSDRDFRFATLEFGTYGVLRMLKALRAENLAHHYVGETEPAFQIAKAELLECFCPKSPAWRTQVVKTGLEVIRQAIRGLEA